MREEIRQTIKDCSNILIEDKKRLIIGMDNLPVPQAELRIGSSISFTKFIKYNKSS